MRSASTRSAGARPCKQNSSRPPAGCLPLVGPQRGPHCPAHSHQVLFGTRYRTPFLSPLPLSDRQLKPLSKALYPESRQKNVAIKGQLCPCADRISVCFAGCRRPSACYLIGDPGTNSELALGNYHFFVPKPRHAKKFHAAS